MEQHLSILHFNDAYHLESKDKDPCGGCARFKTAIDKYKDEKPLLLCSGDLFNPSLMSTVFKGKQMVPVLNALGVHYGVLGNHDFDFGLEPLQKLLPSTKTTWIFTNLTMKDGSAICNAARHVLTEWNGVKIGLLGLVEFEWLETLTFDSSIFKFTDFISTGREEAKLLKSKGAQIVIALTHMRLPNDQLLAAQAEEIDLVLGGHDHFCALEHYGPRTLVKSGNDFRTLSKISIQIPKEGNPKIQVEQSDIKLDLKEDPEMKAIVDGFSSALQSKLSSPIGKTTVQLDARAETLRTGESNIGNFVCDIIKSEFEADCTIINGGTIRSDDLYGPGVLTIKDLFNLFPFEDWILVIKVTGKDLRLALENGVSQYPKHEGRFPQVAGIKFEFDPMLPSGHRIVSVKIGDEDLQPEKEYKLATKSYMAEGKDGYDVLKDKHYIVDLENAQLLSVIVRKYFLKLDVVTKLSRTALKDAVSAFKGQYKKHDGSISPVLDGRIRNLQTSKS
eukprot:TRINITY_DN6532_c0_g1_i1.p1 TRINITY_DN6532_c0_g1~~TRINITY_DN6532_c0_g1_i1.p1  ORF type:complete len:504 (-),score=98.41 TRINITY_DN6532_c0_g1_i1:161-1672(-)